MKTDRVALIGASKSETTEQVPTIGYQIKRRTPEFPSQVQSNHGHVLENGVF